MLSQIRQISDGNYNTVFVKNKEQKFNLDKEIHDLECWKQSRNHVYRKEERELLAHLEKLRHQQECLHHLDEERALHPRGVIPSAGVERRHSRESRGQSNVGNISAASSPGRPELSLALNLQGPSDLPQHGPPPSSPAVSLPSVRSFTAKKELHRTDAYINICVMCQLPRHSALHHGHHVVGEVCCCEHEGNMEPRGRRFTIADFEEHHGSRPPVIEVGQRRHSLMMARLNDDKYEYKPHPPDRSHEGHSKGKDHNNHTHDYHGNIHHHHGHAQHHDSVHHHHGEVHHHHGDVHHHHSHDHHGNASHHHGHDHQGNSHHHHAYVHNHHGNAHHSGNSLHTFPPSTHAHNHQRHNHHGNQTDDSTHTPSNSPHKSSRHSISHLGHHKPPLSRHDPMYFVHHSVERMTTHGNHVTDHLSSTRRTSEVALHLPGNLETGAQDTNRDARRRDHELHWDRHQVCKLRGMITDPHYKEQLEVESGKSYPWSSQYQTNKTSSDGIEELKNCRYLRFSKLNLESMKENPEEEVEVFEKKEDTPSST